MNLNLQCRQLKREVSSETVISRVANLMRIFRVNTLILEGEDSLPPGTDMKTLICPSLVDILRVRSTVSGGIRPPTEYVHGDLLVKQK